MKSVKGVVRNARKTFSLLKNLTEEVGAFAVECSWKYDKKLSLQCNLEKLKGFAEKNNLPIVSEERMVVVNLEGVTMFALLPKDDDEIA